MKRGLILIALGAITFGANAAESSNAPIAVNVDHLQPRLAAEVEKHAAQGEKALARYMERTRFVNRLWFDDVTQPRSEAPALERKVAMREFRKHAIEYR